MAMAIHHNIEQNSEEWLELRAGLITSSKASLIMANTVNKAGDFKPTLALAAPAKRYAITLAAERITKVRLSGGYKNSFMDAGHEYEPVARDAYEFDTMRSVHDAGFFELGFCGSSPDGLVGEDGIVEIKSVIGTTQFERWEKQYMDKTYYWQVMHQLWITGRKWADFVSYCYEPHFPDSKRLFVFRINRDDEAIHKLILRTNFFNQKVKEYQEILIN